MIFCCGEPNHGKVAAHKGGDAMTTRVMTPSDKMITEGQIEKAVTHYRDMLKKHREEIGASEAVQQMLGSSDYLAEQLAVIRKCVQNIRNNFVRVVAVDRSRSFCDALYACGRVGHTNKVVVDMMPRRVGGTVKLFYFKPGPGVYKKGGELSCEALAEEYKKHSLVPDPQAQIDDNAANPEFADNTPNACQWVDSCGNYCFVSFDSWDSERRVYVNRSDRDWSGNWTFAGVPQESLSSGT